jgi:hypothetical protein
MRTFVSKLRNGHDTVRTKGAYVTILPDGAAQSIYQR